MKRIRNILCVIEPGVSSELVLERAADLAEKNQARLTVVDVSEEIPQGLENIDNGPSVDELQDATVNRHSEGLERQVEPYRSRVEIETRVLTGIPFLVIIREVLRNGHDLLLKLPETYDWLDNLLGSNDMHLLRKCPCPVWIIKPRSNKKFRRILVAVDVSDAFTFAKQQAQHTLNQKILEMAYMLALTDFAELHVVHVWDAIGEKAMRGPFMDTPEEQIVAYVQQVREECSNNLEKLIQTVIDRFGEDSQKYVDVKTHLIKGDARKKISELAKKIEADLVVIGTVARTGIQGFIMGNTAETILNQINCSVLAIKPPGFETPVTLED